MSIQEHPNYDAYLKRQHDTWANSKPIEDWRKQMNNPKSNQYLLDLTPRFKIEDDISQLALDLGAGEGYHLPDLTALGWIPVGIEYHEKRVRDAEKLGRVVEQGDMHDLSRYPTDYFGLVWAHEVIEHCADVDRVLTEISRVLCVGGYLVASLPCEGHWKSKKESNLIDKLPPGRDNHMLKTTVKGFAVALDRNGFHDKTIRLCDLGSMKKRGVWIAGENDKGQPHLFVVARK